MIIMSHTETNKSDSTYKEVLSYAMSLIITYFLITLTIKYGILSFQKESPIYVFLIFFVYPFIYLNMVYNFKSLIVKFFFKSRLK